MKIITRYLVRAHAGPFFFALTVLTGLVFLNAVAMQVENLAGKGLPASTITEFLILTLPHVIALTLPMSVLVAVLYTFSDLTAGNEVTAMSAGGVRPRAITIPMLALGILATLVMLFFNDRVLPETNHRLKNLMVDIARKTPTFPTISSIERRLSSWTSNSSPATSADFLPSSAMASSCSRTESESSETSPRPLAMAFASAEISF